MDHSWVPSVRYLLRRARVLDKTRALSPGRLLEVGCGAGSLLAELVAEGHQGTGLETSEAARRLAFHSLCEFAGGEIAIESEESDDWEAGFATILALDVLEHIEDDVVTLKRWFSWLAPGGHILLSVPAHSRRWGSGDIWAGHFRRYDRGALVDVVRAAGMEITHIECYGFPVANLTEWLGERHYRKALQERERNGALEREYGNSRSGIERTVYQRVFAGLSSPLGRALLHIALFLQRMTIGTNWGSGYIVVARKA
ncbi:class I SAM-dependent methyltransferase [Lysobacter cavernae]|uniref:Class I SAM-dependent methyltransferase n=1 Tax=Lysobacter cavernae TaxID=1685901 RepID=A0ABV7RS54_9GAMM